VFQLQFEAIAFRVQFRCGTAWVNLPGGACFECVVSLGSRKKSCLASFIGGWTWSTVDLRRVESKHEHAGSSHRNYSIPSSFSHVVYAMLLFGGRSRVIAPFNFNLGPKCRWLVVFDLRPLCTGEMDVLSLQGIEPRSCTIFIEKVNRITMKYVWNTEVKSANKDHFGFVFKHIWCHESCGRYF
jgi:hypothetical protein